MARPSARVIHKMELGDGTIWEILAAEASYIITYKGKPVGIRTTHILHDKTQYQKLSYTNLGNAIRQVKTLNHRFKCEDFGLMKVGA